MGLTVKTNGIFRPLFSGWELSDSERSEFDYITDWENDTINRFFRYRGDWYDIQEFTRIVPRNGSLGPIGFCHPADSESELLNWDGIQTDSYFSGIVVKYSDDFESVKVGSALC